MCELKEIFDKLITKDKTMLEKCVNQPLQIVEKSVYVDDCIS